ncbi:MAG: hypothetical protein ACI36Y_06650 [Coriobacteriales bacterium]
METAAKKLSPAHIVTRVLSVLVCGVGVSACLFSFTLQIEEMGTTMSSFVWYSGLIGVVLALAGYAATCTPRSGNSWIVPALLAGTAVAGTALELELDLLRSYQVAELAIAFLLVEAVWLVVFHFVLKSQDPEAL